MKAKPWDKHKKIIIQLYHNDGKTLQHVRSFMSEEHGFDASVRSYNNYFKRWEIKKYKCKSRNEKRRISPAAKAPVFGSRSPPKVPVKKEISETLSFITSRRQSSPHRLPLAEIGGTGYPDYKWPQWTRPDETMLHNLYTPTQIMSPSITAFPQENGFTTGARHVQSLGDISFAQLCDLNGPCHMYPFYGTAV